MKKAVIYARQSSGDAELSISIDNQIETCRNWCFAHNVEVVGTYSDYNTSSELYPACEAGEKASQIDNAFLQWQSEQLTKNRKIQKLEQGKMFDFIASTHVDYLVVITHNRLGRPVTNSYLMNFYNSYLMQYNCSLVEASTGNISDYSNAFMTAILNLKQALDYQGVAEKRLQAIEAIKKRKNNGVATSNAYGVITRNKTIFFDTDKAKVIKKVYKDFINGKPMNQTLKELNYSYRNYLTAGAKQFYITNIQSILKNPIYCGFMFDAEKNIIPATNIPEPLVSYSDFSMAQKIFKTNSNKHIHYNVKGESVHFLPLSGYIYCNCGRRMVVAMENGIVYKCQNCGEHRNRIRISNKKEDLFLKKLSQFFIISAVERTKKLHNLKNAEKNKNEKIAELEKKEKALKTKFLMIETEEDLNFFKEEIEQLKNEIKNIKTEIQELENIENTKIENLENEIKKDIDKILNGSLNHEEYLSLLRETIKKITVDEKTITLTLHDDATVDIPLFVDGHKSKKIPEIDITVADVDGCNNPNLATNNLYYTIEINTGNDAILLRTDNYAIVER